MIRWNSIALIIAAIAAVPLIAILVSLVDTSSISWLALWQTTLPLYLTNTTALMIMVGLLSGMIGVSTAWVVTALEFPGRRLFSWLLILPLAAPAYLIAYLYTDLLSFFGPVQSWLRAAAGWQAGDYWFPEIRNLPGAALMLSLVLYPYVYLLTRAAFMAQSGAQWHAARSLGMRPRQAFFRVILPAARPAIAGGLALVLMETLADFGVADYFAIPTFSTGIFRNWLALGDKVVAMKLASVMLVFVIVLVALENTSRRGSFDNNGRISAQVSRIRLSPAHTLLAIVLCALPVLLGFLIPLLGLMSYSVSGGDNSTAAEFFSYTTNSLTVALIVGMVATIAAFLLAYAARVSNNALTSGSIRVATLGYALPGALLAVGLLAPLGSVDQTITRFARDTFGWSSGLILTGTLLILVYALTIRFLTVSFNSVSGGLTKISPITDYAARSLGARPGQIMRYIHLPLLRPSIGAGLMLVFIDVMRELPATLILRPFNFETLATRVYRLASDERLTEASTAALLIILIGIVPVLLLNKVSERGPQT